MSIEPQQQRGEKVRRTLISIASVQDPAILTYGGRRRGLKPRLPLRLSVGCDRLIATSGSGAPELQRGMFAGDRPPHYECGTFFHRRAKNW